MPRKRSAKAGLEPGTLVYIGESSADSIKISFIDYDEAKFEEKNLAGIEEAFPSKDTPTVSWINIHGIHKVDVIEKVGKHFDLHPLLLEDVVNTQQRPKVEDYGEYLFFVVKMLLYDEKQKNIHAKQVCIVLAKNYVISFQEGEGDVFNVVRERIRSGKARIRKAGSDYLAYALIDAIVDNYFGILEKLGDEIELLEDALAKSPTQGSLRSLYRLKKEVMTLRKAIFPLREVLSKVEKTDSPLIRKGTLVYWRDVYDHAVSMIDNTDTFRDQMSELVDIYLSAQSNRLNEVMKVLTVITTLFIPLTFITSIYGMNFENMPELKLRNGYFAVLAGMGLVAFFMLMYFRKKKWL